MLLRCGSGKRGGFLLPPRNHADSQGGGAMGEAIAPCEVARLGKKLRERGFRSPADGLPEAITLP